MILSSALKGQMQHVHSPNEIMELKLNFKISRNGQIWAGRVRESVAGLSAAALGLFHPLIARTLLLSGQKMG
jgi:hypothetical protein